MAKEASFDVVSVVDMQEVDNACQQAARELTQRYDLKGTGSTLELSKKDGVFKILGTKLVKRGVDLTAVRWADPVSASGMSVRQTGTVIQGIDQDTAKKIAKDIRDLKLKAKATVEGDKLRVSSASKDVLQSVIAELRQRDYGQPLQFVNYR